MVWYLSVIDGRSQHVAAILRNKATLGDLFYAFTKLVSIKIVRLVTVTALQWLGR
jgi:hypothetical protein